MASLFDDPPSNGPHETAPVLNPRPATLPFQPPPAQQHSPTSQAAAAKQTKPKTESDRIRILRVLAEHGPMLDEDIGYAADLDGNTERPRRISLVQAGHVRDTGKVGLTHKKHEAALWEITDAGRDYLRSLDSAH
jgi:hypothetical protein